MRPCARSKRRRSEIPTKKSPSPWRRIAARTSRTTNGRGVKNRSGRRTRHGAPTWKWHGAEMWVPVCVPSDVICSSRYPDSGTVVQTRHLKRRIAREDRRAGRERLAESNRLRRARVDRPVRGRDTGPFGQPGRARGRDRREAGSRRALLRDQPLGCERRRPRRDRDHERQDGSPPPHPHEYPMSPTSDVGSRPYSRMV